MSEWFGDRKHITLGKGQRRSFQNSPDLEIKEGILSINSSKVLQRIHKTCVSLVTGCCDPEDETQAVLWRQYGGRTLEEPRLMLLPMSCLLGKSPLPSPAYNRAWYKRV